MSSSPIKPVVILGAMDEEIAVLTAAMEGVQEQVWLDWTFYHGQLAGKPVVVAKSGVGKVFAAMVCQHLIDTFHPDAVIFSGVAGALNPDLEVGDIVISRDCLHHDMDVRALGFERGAIPYSPYRVFTADSDLVKRASRVKVPGHKVRVGRILSGDQFMSRTDAAFEYLTDELAGDAVEMEGAAVGQVCTLNKIPFVIIRTISDKADGSAAVDFPSLLPKVAANSLQLVIHLL